MEGIVKPKHQQKVDDYIMLLIRIKNLDQVVNIFYLNAYLFHNNLFMTQTREVLNAIRDFINEHYMEFSTEFRSNITRAAVMNKEDRDPDYFTQEFFTRLDEDYIKTVLFKVIDSAINRKRIYFNVNSTD